VSKVNRFASRVALAAILALLMLFLTPLPTINAADPRLVLYAVEDNHVCLSEEMGTVTLDGEGPYTGCLSEPLSTGSHSITYSPAPGFMFLNWHVDPGFEGACQFSDVHSQSTTLTITDDCQAEVVYAHTYNFLAKSTDGTELHVKVIVDWNLRNPQTTPFSMPSVGRHTFTAPLITSAGGVTYTFLRWEDEAGVVVSRSPIFTYNLQPTKTFTAIYAKPSYTLLVYASDSRTHRPIVGASVTLDGVPVGSTDSHGGLVIQGVSAGNRQLVISKTGYEDYTTTINIKSNGTLIAILNRI
jgi:hypothetical protein